MDWTTIVIAQNDEKEGQNQDRGNVMWKYLNAYLRDEEGQTSTEYVLLLVVVALLVMKFRDKATSGIENVTTSVFNKANDMAEELGRY